MPRAIFVSGPINAGKTTVSRLLARRLPGTAHVEGDALRHFVSWMPLEEAVPITLANLAAVSRNFLRAGRHVIVDYLLSAEQHAELVAALEPESTSVHSFVLAPPLHVALRERGRRLNDWERARICELYDQRIHEPGFGIQLDTGELTAEQTVEEILDHLGKKRRG
jgi:adenylylsulfate kinase-like enzyme